MTKGTLTETDTLCVVNKILYSRREHPVIIMMTHRSCSKYHPIRWPQV